MFPPTGVALALVSALTESEMLPEEECVNALGRRVGGTGTGREDEDDEVGGTTVGAEVSPVDRSKVGRGSEEARIVSRRRRAWDSSSSVSITSSWFSSSTADAEPENWGSRDGPDSLVSISSVGFVEVVALPSGAETGGREVRRLIGNDTTGPVVLSKCRRALGW